MRTKERVRSSPIIAVVLAVGASSPADAGAQGFASDSAWLASKGFQQRASDALLHGDREAIRSWRQRSVSDVLEGLPRVEVRQGAGDRFFVMHASPVDSDGAADPPCTLPVYLNGARVHPADGRPATVRAVDRAVRLRDLDGIEVHSALTSPVGEGTACGSVLLWSRRATRDVDADFVARLRGRAFWAGGGEPAGGIAIALEPGGMRQSTDSGGWFDFGTLPPGRYRITATAPDGASWSGNLLLKAFGIARVEIEVSRGEETGAW